MSEWSNVIFKDIAEFNPRESIKKGEIATKIGMDKLQPFCRDIPEIEHEVFSGGTKFRNGDTIMARITPCLENGKTAMVNILNDDEVGFGSTEYIVLRAKKGITDPYFLYYLVCSSTVREPAIKSMVGSSGRQRVQTDVIENMELLVPPFEKQKIIGEFLKIIDDKITVNNKINRNLEEQARVVFNSWFVKFEPFNEQMKESPIGYEVPETLELVQISSLEHILETGRRPKGGAVTEGVPSVGAESVKGIGNFGTGSIKFIPEDFAAKLKTGEVKGYELMIYKDGGKPGEFHPHFSMFGEGYPFEKFFINEHVFKLDFGNRGYNEFAYFYFQTDYVLNWLESNGGKAAIPGINQNDVNSIWIFKPNHPKVKEYCEWVQPLFTQILKNCYANMQLSSLRDTLLPKLMSGELDVSDLDI